MADFWMTSFRSNGWPEHTNIFVEATDGKGGQPLSGQVSLAMRKGSDLNSTTPIEISDYNMVAEFERGKWAVTDLNLKAFADASYDTLILDAQGRKVPRTFRSGQSSPNTNRIDNRRDDGNKKQEEILKFSCFDYRPPKRIVKEGKLVGFNILVTGILLKGKKPAKDTEINLFGDGRKDPDSPIKTDGDGNFSHTFRNIPAGGREGDNIFRIEARVPDTDVRSKALSVEVPLEEEKKEKPKEPPKWTVTAKLARPHPVRDWFIVAGTTNSDGKLMDCEFKATTIPTEVEIQAGIGTITPQRGQIFTVQSSGGNFTFSIKFSVDEAELVLQLLDGTTANVPMVKPID